MTPKQAYQRTSRQNWSRIDMLLAIYNETEQVLRAAAKAQCEDDTVGTAKGQLRATRLLLLLLEGIDPNADEIAHNIHRLCLYMLQEIASQSEDRFENVLRVLGPLKEGFAGVRDEAILLEQEGTILPLNFGSLSEMAVG